MDEQNLRDQLTFLRDLGYTHLRLDPHAGSSTRAEVREEDGSAWSALESEAMQCTRCPLSKGRTHVVFGSGNRAADLMFIGEAPGRDEDLEGLPFVGRAGKLLTDIIQAMTLRREDVYIANVIKCRPPGNRNPEPQELDACRSLIERQIDLVSPKAIVTLGKVAYQSLFRSQAPISAARGSWQRLGEIPLMPTYHPAYLLRNPAAKRDVWEDMKKVMELLEIPIENRR